MPPSLFYKNLLVVTAACSAVLILLHFLLEPFRTHQAFAVACVVVFFLLSTGLYYAGKGAVNSSSKVAFNGLVTGSVFGKMVLAIAMLFIYQSITKPENRWFVGIFLFVYVVYTVFEVWFLSRIAKSK